MNAPYVCLKCSRQLVRLKCRRRSSSFISLGQLVDRDDSDNTTTAQELPLNNGNSTAKSWQAPKRHSKSPPKYQERRKPKDVDIVLESLFTSNRGHEQALERSRYSRTPKTQAPPIKIAESEISSPKKSIEARLENLSTRLSQETAPLHKIWSDCEALLRDTTKIGKVSMGYGDNKTPFDDSTWLLNTPAGSNALRRVLLAICQSQRLVIDGRNFTPADALKIYMEYGVRISWWSRILWYQISQVLELRYWCADETAEAKSKAKIPIILGNIIGVWDVYAEGYSSRSGCFINPLSKDSDKADHTTTSKEISSSFTDQRQLSLHQDITTAAVMTLECLEAAGIETPVCMMDLFNRFGKAMKRDQWTAKKCLLHAGAYSEVIEKALEGWESRVPPESEAIPKPIKAPQESGTLNHSVRKGTNQDWGSMNLRERLQAIGGAASQRNPQLAINLWGRFQADVEANKPEVQDVHDHIYARFLRTFWALRRHNEAIEVWNHMINWGYPPNSKHWTAMLTGCVIARDLDSLRRIWSNMLNSGALPGITDWTTYIHGLINCHKWEEGFNALEQLGRIWKSAPPPAPSETATDKTTKNYLGDDSQETEERKFGSVLRPSENPVCGALSALIHTDRRSKIPRVLAWARANQVPLSNYTYNILLRPIVRSGSQTAIQAHLKQMAEANCPPDVVTFTIILNGLVSNPTSTFHSLSPETQDRTIASILADMQTQGMEPTPFTYVTLLDGLLTPGSRDVPSDNYTPNVKAARTVLFHMARRNIYPSTHLHHPHHALLRPAALAGLRRHRLPLVLDARVQRAEPAGQHLLRSAHRRVRRRRPRRGCAQVFAEAG